jgi:hypothetical protein
LLRLEGRPSDAESIFELRRRIAAHCHEMATDPDWQQAAVLVGEMTEMTGLPVSGASGVGQAGGASASNSSSASGSSSSSSSSGPGALAVIHVSADEPPANVPALAGLSAAVAETTARLAAHSEKSEHAEISGTEIETLIGCVLHLDSARDAPLIARLATRTANEGSSGLVADLRKKREIPWPGQQSEEGGEKSDLGSLVQPLL